MRADISLGYRAKTLVWNAWVLYRIAHEEHLGGDVRMNKRGLRLWEDLIAMQSSKSQESSSEYRKDDGALLNGGADGARMGQLKSPKNCPSTYCTVCTVQ